MGLSKPQQHGSVARTLAIYNGRSSTCEQRDNCPTLTDTIYVFLPFGDKQYGQFSENSNQCVHLEVPIKTYD